MKEPRTPAETDIRNYLAATLALRTTMGPRPEGLAYHGMDDLLLQHGRFYQSAPLSPAEKDYLSTVLTTYGRRCPIKQCFYNSQMVLLSANAHNTQPDMTLQYVEGYAHSGLLPIHHGWLTLNGKVIDPTLRLKGLPKVGPLAGRVKGTFPAEVAYFGIPFSTDGVLKSVLQRSEGGSLIIDYKRKFPFLTKPYAPPDE